jgi:hypothetical protein
LFNTLVYVVFGVTDGICCVLTLAVALVSKFFFFLRFGTL